MGNKRNLRPSTPPREDFFLERLALGATQRIGSLPSLIAHSVFFVGIFGLQYAGVSFERIMLILTTVVSLEAIYLSIFIQMTINRQARQIEEVSEDVEDIQDNVEELSEGIDEIQEDVEEISKDIDEIQEDVEGIQEDAKEISEDVEDIQEHIEQLGENVEDISEELEKDDKEEAAERTAEEGKIAKIEQALEELLREIKTLKQ